jgi:hypothetical protein
MLNTTTTAGTINTGTTPDEYAAVFSLPYKTTAIAAVFPIGSIGATDDFEFVFYTDPLGSPVAAQTLAIDPDFSGATSNGDRLYLFRFPSSVTIEPNVWYGIAVRPTTANSINFMYYSLGSGNSSLKNLNPFGVNIKLTSRTNQTGAFVETETYHLPVFQLFITTLDDGKRERSSTF